MARSGWSRLYWTTTQLAEQYFLVHPLHVPTCVTWILDLYQQFHPPWQPGVSKIPLIVDVGCGSGQLSAPLASHCQRILAIDSSPTQLVVGRRENSRPNVEYIEGPAEELSRFCPAGEVDLIVCGMAAHYFDTEKFYSEVRRCLRPGGLMAIMGFCYQGIRHESPKFSDLYTDLSRRKAVDDYIRKTMMKIRDSYRSLYCPLEVVSRRETTLDVDMTREDIRKVFMGVSQLYRGGAATVNEAVDGLPAMDKYSFIIKVFGLFCRC